jgi:hypothetical protein
VLFALVVQATQSINWVGAKDLEITFRIVDADSDAPIKGARVNVLHEWCNFCSEDQKPPFALAASEEGIARHLSKQCMCFGTAGGWGPTKKDTFAIHIPTWLLSAEAPGYRATEPFELDTIENRRRTVRGQKAATLEVVLRLQREIGVPNPGDQLQGK